MEDNIRNDVQERIKVDAETATENQASIHSSQNMEYAPMIMRLFGYKEGYIAGATAENSGAQVLADALRVISELDTPISLDEYKTAFEYITKSIAATALQQWKEGKEVENGIH